MQSKYLILNAFGKNNILILSFIMLSQMQIKGQNISELLEYGRRAPSSHNAQMWKVDTTYNSIRIELDSTRLLKEVDPLNREAWISLGAFAESCILSAYDFYYDCDETLDSLGINLLFSKNETINESNYREWITERKTIRKPYKKKELNEEHLQIIQSFDVENIFYYSRFSNVGDSIVNSICNSNVIQFNDSAKLKELSDWMIASRKEDKLREDGLSPSDLGLNSFTKFFFYILFNKEKLQTNRFVKVAQKDAMKQANNCSGFIVITSNTNNREEWFNSGRLLQRLWIKLTELGISVHPMSQSIEESLYSNLKEDLSLKDKEIQMLLRVGYSNGRKDQSKRRELF